MCLYRLTILVLVGVKFYWSKNYGLPQLSPSKMWLRQAWYEQFPGFLTESFDQMFKQYPAFPEEESLYPLHFHSAGSCTIVTDDINSQSLVVRRYVFYANHSNNAK